MAYESKFKKEDIDELFEAVLTLRDLEDCYRFFQDICTINELHAIAQRLQVAKLLSEKKTYSEIEAITNASTATISRINKCLIYGADGYQRVLERLKEKEKAKAQKGRRKASHFAHYVENIAQRYFRNHDKSTLRSGAHGRAPCMHRNPRFRCVRFDPS